MAAASILKILEEGGRSDHWGSQGMRERAEKIGGQLNLWSRPERPEPKLSCPFREPAPIKQLMTSRRSCLASTLFRQQRCGSESVRLIDVDDAALKRNSYGVGAIVRAKF